MNVASLLKQAEKIAIDNSPVICTAIGVVGTVVTAVLTHQAALKADDILDADANHQLASTGSYNPPKPMQHIKLVWPVYIPPVLAGATTIICIVASNKISNRRAAAIAAAYTISERAFAEYKEKVVEKIGEKKEKNVRDEVAQDRVNRTSKNDREVVILGNGDVLFWDSLTGRYFNSNVEAIRKAVNDINFQIRNDNYASLSDFFNKIGLPTTSLSEELGWNLDTECDVDFSTTITDDDRPCIVINYRVHPIRGYHRLV